ncbi:hypothetical protein [Chamaesiphon sp.]|uniref:hypothetical protein n=1 Tax=Chamaesiphon sp. TaxID=2814140 RepID=UPI0035933020
MKNSCPAPTCKPLYTIDDLLTEPYWELPHNFDRSIGIGDRDYNHKIIATYSQKVLT